MRALRPGMRRRGFSLVELVVALVLAAVVLGGTYQVLVSSQRFYRAQAAMLEVHETLRAVVEVLSAELRELDACGGDLVAVAPDSISIRATRRLEFICTPREGAATIVVRNSLSSGFRAVDPSRDRALIFREGDPEMAGDDGWLDFGISSAGPRARCGDGAAGTALALVGRAGALDSLTVGSPVRIYERAVYRLYADDGGAWWLGLRTYANGAWAAISPVAGPLRGGKGLVFTYHDAGGDATTDPSSVAWVGLAARAVSSAVLQGAGGVQGPYADSLSAAVALRNCRQAGPP